MVDTEEVKARNKEAFRQLWDRVNTAYTACGNDDIALENFATSHNDDFRTLYTLKKYADPTLAKHFKQISDRLAWKLGVPPKAVSEFSQHKDINGWEADASGTTMNFPLKAGGIKCHNNLLQKIKKDFAKMAPGYTWKDEWLVGNPPALISIPRPESAALQNFLSGRYLASHANAANTPITSQLAKKVVVDPLFKAWDDYQKKLLAAAESPEAMLTGLCELTFMLPFNLLNECVSGLNSFLKDELAKTGASNTPQNPSAPGTPGNPTPGTPGRNPDPTPGGNPNTDPRIRTVGDAQALVSRLTQIQTFNIALLAELGRMDDPKSQALFKLMNEWLNDSAKPEVLRDPAKEGALKKKQAAATAQLEEMRPFIIKYAQEHGHAALIKMMKTVYPEGTIEDTKTKAQLANIAKGLTPLGHKIEGQTAPDFNQLYDTLKQNTWHGKNTDFQGAYNALELDHQNNALVSAVQRIMANDKLSDSERKKQFQKLMDQSIWTPTDIAAANALIAKLNEQGRLKTPINMKEVKPYGLESSGHEQNI